MNMNNSYLSASPNVNENLYIISRFVQEQLRTVYIPGSINKSPLIKMSIVVTESIVDLLCRESSRHS
jgi:hypothetical protein